MHFLKFKCRNHNLPCTLGRVDRYNVTEDINKCTICDSNKIGDEYHYLFECDYFKNDRIKFINKYYRVRPTTQKMYELFTCSSS